MTSPMNSFPVILFISFLICSKLTKKKEIMGKETKMERKEISLFIKQPP